MSLNYDTLLWFHVSPVHEIIGRFEELPGAISIPGSTPSIYVPGTRKDRVLLVAHSDTVWDDHTDRTQRKLQISRRKILHSLNPKIGTGSDDRAGCMALWELRNMGHSLLLCSDEETGCWGATQCIEAIPDELAEHQFALEFDRRGSRDLAVYGAHTLEFLDYLRSEFYGYHKVHGTFTDISLICESVGICGANLSVGYYHEHTAAEILRIPELRTTIQNARRLLDSRDIPKFSPPEPSHHTQFYTWYNRRSGYGAASYGTTPCKRDPYRGSYIFDDDGPFIDGDPDDIELADSELPDTVEDPSPPVDNQISDDYPGDYTGDYYCQMCANLNTEEELDDPQARNPRCVYCGTEVVPLFDDPDLQGR